MAVTTKDYPTLVSDQIKAAQGASSNPLPFKVGSPERALVEAQTGVALWLQGLMLQVLALTRASTSSAGDLDTWIADFGLKRVGAKFASGSVSFSRFTATLPALVPVGATVQTSDGTQQFSVVADPTNLNWRSGQNGYTIAAGVVSIVCPVVALVAGAQGNALAGTISQLTTSIPSVDTVSNTLPFTNGVDPESDTALRARFVSFILSLAKATRAAIGNAIAGVQANLVYSIVENRDTAGNAAPASFYAVVDDGTGAPPALLLSLVASAIDAVRALGISFSVLAPQVIPAVITMTLVPASGYTHDAVSTAVQAAIVAYVNGLGLGIQLSYSRIAQVALGVPGVFNVTGILLNNGTSDITPTTSQTIKTSNPQVIVG
jgi:uncharacterized phage protein gp47/JayE